VTGAGIAYHGRDRDILTYPLLRLADDALLLRANAIARIRRRPHKKSAQSR
jgi:hypothetical protein